MRNTTAALAMGAVLAVAPAVSAQSRPAAGGTPIIVVVSVADHANVPLKTLIAAEEDAAAIYGAAGVQTLWVNVPSEPVVTQIAGRTRDLRLNLLSRELTGTLCGDRLTDSAMGVAFSNSNDRGVIAYVFYDRVKRNAVEHHAAVSRLLGEVMAHEVGHMLLPSGSHSIFGLMRAAWAPRFGVLEQFTKDQGKLMRSRLADKP